MVPYHTYLDDFVLDGGIAPGLSRHELLPFYRVAIDRERYRRRLDPPIALPEEAACGTVRIHHVKSATVHVDRAADRDIVDVVAPGSPLRKWMCVDKLKRGERKSVVHRYFVGQKNSETSLCGSTGTSGARVAQQVFLSRWESPLRKLMRR